MLEYMTIAELTCAAREQGKKLSEVVLADQSAQMEIKAEELYARMERSLDVMQEAIKAGMDPNLRSTSGLTGGDAAKMLTYSQQGGMTGSFLNFWCWNPFRPACPGNVYSTKGNISG